MIAQAEVASTMDDPWEGFAWFLAQCCETQAADRAYNELCVRVLPDTPEIDRLKARGHELVGAIVSRAQRAGQLRGDFDDGDFAFVLWSTTTIIDVTAATAPDAWRRHLAFLLDGLRASAAHPLPGPPLSQDQVAEAMRMHGG